MMLSRRARRARFATALAFLACGFACANMLADDLNPGGSSNLLWAVASLIFTIQGGLMLRADWLDHARRLEALAAMEPVDDPAAARVSLTKNDAKTTKGDLR